MLINDQNVSCKLYIKIQSQIEETYAYIRIYSIITYIFGAIAIKLATKLTDTYSLNSTVTLTPKFQRSSDKLSMSLEVMVRFARNKSSMNKLVDLFHIWP